MNRYGLPERRRLSRAYIRIPVECEIIDPKDNSVTKTNLLSRNINSEGMYFETDRILSLNTQINTTFQIPKDTHVIHASLRVTRIEILGEENDFGVGAAFISLKEEDRERIKQLIDKVDINQFLTLCIEKEASDLHLLAEQPPVVRINGELQSLEAPKLSSDDIITLIYSLMSRQQIRRFEEEKELNFGVQFDTNNRFRVNLHQQKGFAEAAFRLVNTKVLNLKDLNIPDVVEDLVKLKDGLILITGPTGSGKTTTIAAIVEFINQYRKAVIITLERPIEYLYTSIKSIIKQREVGVDTLSFSTALKNCLRQDPNVIVIGELEDIETVKTAIIAAESGHLVIASFHAPNAIQALDRLASIFPPESRRQLLSQLSYCLKGVISQLLIPRKDRTGRVLATEVLVTNEALKRVIRNDELIQIATIIQTGGEYKMQSMYDSIKRLLEKGVIDNETANVFSEEFTRYSRKGIA